MNWYSVIGLFFDLFGVFLLGIDLIRLQVTIRRSAQQKREMFDKLESDYGGTESWMKDIENQSEWISDNPYYEFEVHDEVSTNSRYMLDRTKDIAIAVQGLAAYLSKLTTILETDANQSERTANSSFRFSIAGIVFIIIGFGLQIIGAWPSL